IGELLEIATLITKKLGGIPSPAKELVQLYSKAVEPIVKGVEKAGDKSNEDNVTRVETLVLTKECTELTNPKVFKGGRVGFWGELSDALVGGKLPPRFVDTRGWHSGWDRCRIS